MNLKFFEELLPNLKFRCLQLSKLVFIQHQSVAFIDLDLFQLLLCFFLNLYTLPFYLFELRLTQLFLKYHLLKHEFLQQILNLYIYKMILNYFQLIQTHKVQLQISFELKHEFESMGNF